MRLDLTLFGGRGGDATSARWMDGFFKAAVNGTKSSAREAGSGSKEERTANDDRDEIKAAKKIYNAMKRSKNGGSVWSGAIGAENRVLEAFAKMSKAVKYDSGEGRLTVKAGMLTQARRDFEIFIKNKFWQYYDKGKVRAPYGSYLKKLGIRK